MSSWLPSWLHSGLSGANAAAPSDTNDDQRVSVADSATVDREQQQASRERESSRARAGVSVFEQLAVLAPLAPPPAAPEPLAPAGTMLAHGADLALAPAHEPPPPVVGAPPPGLPPPPGLLLGVPPGRNEAAGSSAVPIAPAPSLIRAFGGDFRPRTADAMRQAAADKYDAPAHLSDLPQGPWDCPWEPDVERRMATAFEHAAAEMKAWHLMKGHAVVQETRRAGNTHRGPQFGLACHLHGQPPRVSADQSRQCGSAKCNCPYKIWLEWTVDGWVPCYFQKPEKSGIAPGAHNHDPVLSRAEANAHASMRGIPREFHAFIEESYDCGMQVHEINMFLHKMAARTSTEIAWTSQDIQNQFGASKADRLLDMQNTLEDLDTRQIHHKHFIGTLTGKLEGLFWVPSIDALEKFARGAKLDFADGAQPDPACPSIMKKPIIFDMTHGLTKYNMKLGVFSSVDENNKTVVLAVVLLRHEDDSSFRWAFEKFEEFFGAAPFGIFTDQDLAMKSARAAVWPNTIHFLCTFHLWKNFYEHVHGLFVSKPAAWTKAASAFWQVAKETDVRSQTEFDTNWNALRDYVATEGQGSAAKMASAASWFERIGALKKTWAARFVDTHTTFGIHSTQRAEAVNSSLKHFLASHLLLKQLVGNISSTLEMQTTKKHTEVIRQAVRLACRSHPNPIAVELAKGISPFAAEMLHNQASQAVAYTVVPVEPTGDDAAARPVYEQVFTVTHNCVASMTVASLPTNDSEVRTSGTLTAIEQGDGSITRLFSSWAQRGRMCSLRSCSCQFPKNRGVPCRHQLAVAQRLNITPAAIEDLKRSGSGYLAVHPHWRLEDPDLQLTASICRQRRPQPQASVTDGPDLSTKAAREAEITARCRQVTEIACTSRGETIRALEQLSSMVSSMRDRMVSAAEPSEAASAAAAASAAEHSEADDDGRAGAAGAAVGGNPSPAQDKRTKRLRPAAGPTATGRSTRFCARRADDDHDVVQMQLDPLHATLIGIMEARETN